MKVAKTFRWESAHRLPLHDGACRNLHGHSYGMTVTIDGTVGPDGIVIDFKHIKNLAAPLIDAWDHATLIATSDHELLAAAQQLGSKVFMLPSETTAENLCLFAIQHIQDSGRDILQDCGATSIGVRVQETETCFAEIAQDIVPDVAPRSDD